MRKKTLLLLIIVGAAFANFQPVQTDKWTAPKQADQLKNPMVENTKATEKGKKIYTKLCWSCHGKAGLGDGPAAVALVPSPINFTDETVQKQSDGAIFWKITNGRGSMASYESTLSESQRWMLVNYIRVLGGNERLP